MLLLLSLVTLLAFNTHAYAQGKDNSENQARGFRGSEERPVESSNIAAVRKLYIERANKSLAMGKPVETGEAYVELGEITEIRGDFPAAEASLKKGLNLLKGFGPPNGLRLVIALDDLGWLYLTWGRVTEGHRLLEQARNLAMGAAPNDPRLIRHLDVQAASAMVFGRYSEAQKAWNRALEIGEMIYGPDGPQYDHVLVHFAQGSALFGDYASAEKMFRKYLAIEGDNNSGTPEYAVVAGELARIDTQLHRYAEAQSWFAAATGIMDRNPASAPLVRSTILCYLGDYYMARGDWSNAQARYSEALRIQQSVLGENRAVAVSMIALSKALKKLHLKDQARNLMARAKTILSSHTDPLQQATVDVMALRRQ